MREQQDLMNILFKLNSIILITEHSIEVTTRESIYKNLIDDVKTELRNKLHIKSKPVSDHIYDEIKGIYNE